MDYIVLLGLVLGQKCRISSTDTGAVVYCSVSDVLGMEQ